MNADDALRFAIRRSAIRRDDLDDFKGVIAWDGNRRDLNRQLFDTLYYMWHEEIPVPIRILSWLIWHGADLSFGRVVMKPEIRELVGRRRIRFLDVEEEMLS